MAAVEDNAVVSASEAKSEDEEAQSQTPGPQKGEAETTPSGGTWLRKNLSMLKKQKEKLSTPSGDSPAAAEQASSSVQGKGADSGDFLSFEQEEEPAKTHFGGDFISFDDVSSETKKRKAESEEPPEEPVSAPASQVKKAKSLAAFVDRRSPWSRGQKYQTNTGDATVDLHLEILDFVTFISPTKQEIKRRTTLVELFENIVADLWPGAELKVFGSYATGMYLPSSDIDMVVMGCEDSHQHALHKIAKIIRADENFDKIQVIDKARVPIIKFEDVPSGIPLNICIGQEDGLKNTEWVKEQKVKLPALAPLLLVLKQFLYNRDLHETYTGGIGSYLLTMTIISHLQHHPGCGPDHTTADSNLGALLIDYLHLYGLRFNMEEIGISVRKGGKYFKKEARGWDSSARSFLWSVEDPNKTDSDIGKNSYNIRNVQRAFEHAFYSLVVRDGTQTPLGSILQWDQRWDSAFAEHRLQRFKKVKGHTARDTPAHKHAHPGGKSSKHRRHSETSLQLHSKKRKLQMAGGGGGGGGGGGAKKKDFPRRHSAGGKFEYDSQGRLSTGKGGKKWQSPHSGQKQGKKRKF